MDRTTHAMPFEVEGMAFMDDGTFLLINGNDHVVVAPSGIYRLRTAR